MEKLLTSGNRRAAADAESVASSLAPSPPPLLRLVVLRSLRHPRVEFLFAQHILARVAT